MSARHGHRAGDWASIAARLDELVSAASGEDPFEAALALLVAKAVHEIDGRGPFLPDPAPAALAGLLDRAAARWPGIGEARCVLGAADLGRCAELLRGEDLLADDLVGLDAVFEVITSRTAKGRKGQFFTPRHVVDALVRMVAPRDGERVVDPACGSGAMLRRALREAPGARVFGFDLDPRAARVARVMMAASGQPPGVITRLDSLALRGDTIEAAAPGGFDVVVTNPPFAGDVGAVEGYALGGRRAERDVLFLERCVGLLRPGGRLGVVLPHNKLGGAAWAHARRWLLAHARVVAVVGLGRNTFLPHTSQKACVLLAERRPEPVEPPADEEVLLFVSERDGRDARGRPTLRDDGALDCDLDEAVGPARAAWGGAAWAG